MKAGSISPYESIQLQTDFSKIEATSALLIYVRISLNSDVHHSATPELLPPLSSLQIGADLVAHFLGRNQGRSIGPDVLGAQTLSDGFADRGFNAGGGIF
jgi:hypothetical protein